VEHESLARLLFRAKAAAWRRSPLKIVWLSESCCELRHLVLVAEDLQLQEHLLLFVEVLAQRLP
jgi:hypothetical protein